MATGRARLGELLREHRLAIAYGAVIVLAGAMRLFGDTNPHVAEGGWPELWFRAHHWMQRALRAYWSWRYGQDDFSLGCVFAVASQRLLLPMRWVGAGLATATVALVMRLGWLAGPRRLTASERHAVALGAGLFYCVDVLATRDAHFAVSDQPLLFFMTWMFVAAARGLERGFLVDFLSCGLALGFAIACKWTGLPFALVPVIALGIRIRRHGLEPRNVAALLLGIGGAIFAFVITNPTVLSQPTTFLEGVTSVALRYDPNAPRAFSIYTEAPIEYGITRHARVSFPFAFGYPLTVLMGLASLGCMGIGWRQRTPSTFLMGFWTLFFWAAIVGRTTLYFARYALPAHPTACVAAAIVIVLTARWIARRRFEKTVASEADLRRRAWIAAAITIVLAIEPTIRSIETTSILAQPDTRERAVAWLRAHAGDAPIDVLGGYSRPIAISDRVADACEARLPEGFAPPVLRLQGAPDDSHLVGGPSSWHPLGAALVYWGLLHNAPSATAHWVVAAQPFLPCGQPVNRFLAYDPPARCYHEVARFDPQGIACDAMWDDQDHFYMALWGFERFASLPPDAARYGPSIVVWERTCE